jgi:uncharacterized protein YdiU (UPF0061 family)
MYTPNMTDFQGRRYAYKNQPQIGFWNCLQLAQALFAADLVEESEAQSALDVYGEGMQTEYNARMAAKLGLSTYDKDLDVELFKIMYQDDADWTNTFRALANVSSSLSSDKSLPSDLRMAIGAQGQGPSAENEANWIQWLETYKIKLRLEGKSDEERRASMNKINPKFIPRQHLLQYAIDGAEVGDPTELLSLMEVLRRPYDEQPEADKKYSALPPPEMAGRPGVCVLSCSS